MINRVILEGYLCSNPELKKTTTGLSVATFTIANNRRKKEDGTQETDFIKCVVWRAPAEYASNFAKKGNMVSIVGHIQTRNYDGTDGKKVYVTEVVCDEFNLLERREKQESQPIPSYSGESFEDFNAGPALDISSDDLPF